MKKREIAVVARDGRKTYARVFSPEGISSGEAYCHPGDEYRPEVGAVIALARAYEAHPEKLCYDILSLYARDKASVNCIKLNDPCDRKAHGMKKVPAGRVKTGKLHLTTDHEGMGVPGTPTKFKDMNGKSLFVGDLVSVAVLTGDVRYGRKWVDAPELVFVVDEESDNEKSKGQYIMGALTGCNEKTGKIDGRIRVKLAKSWREVEVGEQHGVVRLEWTEG